MSPGIKRQIVDLEIWPRPIFGVIRLGDQTAQRLVYDPCFNIAASALILRSYLAETNGALLPAIGDYHSHTPALNNAYTVMAENKARELFADQHR
jgi:hypothetical protein